MISMEMATERVPIEVVYFRLATKSSETTKKNRKIGPNATETTRRHSEIANLAYSLGIALGESQVGRGIPSRNHPLFFFFLFLDFEPKFRAVGKKETAHLCSLMPGHIFNFKPPPLPPQKRPVNFDRIKTRISDGYPMNNTHRGHSHV